MANYCGFARSNYVYFDETKLEALKTLFSITTYTDPDGLTCILSDDESGTPSCYDPDPEAMVTLGLDPEVDEIDFLEVVHLAFADDPGGLFVWEEVGFEKLRYLTGFSIAIDATGEVINQVSLSDIYKTEDVNTRAEY